MSMWMCDVSCNWPTICNVQPNDSAKACDGEGGGGASNTTAWLGCAKQRGASTASCRGGLAAWTRARLRLQSLASRKAFRCELAPALCDSTSRVRTRARSRASSTAGAAAH